MDPFQHLPDSARLWVFGTSRPLTSGEVSRFLGEVDQFLDGWRAHGHPLAAARAWHDGRFLLVGVDDRVTPPSGCSIDALVRILRRLEEDMGLTLVGNDPIWYRDEVTEGIVRASRAEFREAARAGKITAETRVIDPTLTRIGELRSGRLELPAGESWHQAFLPS